MKAKESSKMPVHRAQYIGFIRAVTANEIVREREKISEKESRFKLNLKKKNGVKGPISIQQH